MTGSQVAVKRGVAAHKLHVTLRLEEFPGDGRLPAALPFHSRLPFLFSASLSNDASWPASSWCSMSLMNFSILVARRKPFQKRIVIGIFD